MLFWENILQFWSLFAQQAGKLGSIPLSSLSALNGLGGFGTSGAINPAGNSSNHLYKVGRPCNTLEGEEGLYMFCIVD